jgi:xylan 1,4-beta-xylosidase
MGIASQLQDIDRGFEIVASFPELKGKPIIIGESDPDGCAACPASVYPQNGYRTGTMFSSYTAAVFARKYALAAKHGVNFEGAVTWAFEFEDQPYFAGFRVLETNGLALPVLNVFRMFGLMGATRLAVESSGDVGLEEIRARGVRGSAPDISALAARQGDAVSVLVWNYHDDDLPRPGADVALELRGLPAGDGPLLLEHFRIDRDHSNAFEEWKRIGSPQSPTPEQLESLRRASNLTMLAPPSWVHARDGQFRLKFALPAQGVSLLLLRKPAHTPAS